MTENNVSQKASINEQEKVSSAPVLLVDESGHNGHAVEQIAKKVLSTREGKITPGSNKSGASKASKASRKRTYN